MCLQDARVWIPDAEVVWKSAVLLQDYKGQKEIDIQYEDGDVSTHENSPGGIWSNVRLWLTIFYLNSCVHTICIIRCALDI